VINLDAYRELQSVTHVKLDANTAKHYQWDKLPAER